jgi:hypothetical protein
LCQRCVVDPRVVGLDTFHKLAAVEVLWFRHCGKPSGVARLGPAALVHDVEVAFAKVRRRWALQVQVVRVAIVGLLDVLGSGVTFVAGP